MFNERQSLGCPAPIRIRLLRAGRLPKSCAVKPSPTTTMKKALLALIGASLCVACEQRVEPAGGGPDKVVEKDTTVVNPPASGEKKETTIVNPPAAEKKTETNTTVTPPGGASSTTTTTKEQ